MRLTALLTALLLVSAGCGYHVAGKADLMPKNIHTIAVMPFGNNTGHYKLARLMPTDITHEFNERTHYKMVTDPAQADAVLKGNLLSFNYYGIASDPTGHATGVQLVVTVQLTLTDRVTGKVLFTRPAYEFRERYEVAGDPQQYFDESGTAIQRVSRDMSRSTVTAILEMF